MVLRLAQLLHEATTRGGYGTSSPPSVSQSAVSLHCNIAEYFVTMWDYIFRYHVEPHVRDWLHDRGIHGASAPPYDRLLAIASDRSRDDDDDDDDDDDAKLQQCTTRKQDV